MNHLRKTSDGTWEVRLVVPQGVRDAIGRSNLTKRLGRVSPSEANRLAVPIVAEFQARIAQARLGIPAKATDSFESQLWGEVKILPIGWNPNHPTPATPVPAVSLSELYNGYEQERELAPATRKRWRPVIGHLVAHLGHDNAAAVTPENIVEWKEALLCDRSQRTVREVYLAAVKAVYGWGIENRRLKENPATGISVRVPKERKLRGKGFTPDEAAKILREALHGHHGGVSVQYQRARRWVPWVCAYTGARVGEISQMRGADVLDMDGVPVLRITPEAGGTKTNAARLVPLHPHLIEMGFIQFVRGIGEDALFYDPFRNRGGNAGNPQHKKVGEHIAKWVREIGVDDPDVKPNHGWRHLFKTLCRTASIDPEARDAIQGHATRTEGEAYGEWDIQPLAKEMAKFPRYQI